METVLQKHKGGYYSNRCGMAMKVLPISTERKNMCNGIPSRGEVRLISQFGVPGNNLRDTNNRSKLRGLAVS